MHFERFRPDPDWQPSGLDMGRRRALVGISGVFVAAMTSAAARAQTPRSCVLTPDAGEGPFYLDPKLLRADITSGQPGAPLELSLQVVRQGDCATLSDARVDVWQADAIGLYSGYEKQSGVGGVSTAGAVGKQYLRGTQVTNRQGRVEFRTIFPSWYGGRTPHVHFKVFLSNAEVVASQLFFPDEISKEVFSQFEPYRTHVSKRKTFNDNDPIREGIYSEVTRRQKGYVAEAVLVVAAKK